MTKVELYELIRKQHFVQGKSIRQIAYEQHVHRRVVRQAIDSAIPPDRKAVSKLGLKLSQALKSVIDDWLQKDLSAPKKQRHTAKRIYVRLVDEHDYQGSEHTIRKHVGQRRRELGLTVQAFVPQHYWPGEHAEVDWYEAQVLLNSNSNSNSTRVYCFQMRACYSGREFHLAFLSQNQQAFGEVQFTFCAHASKGCGLGKYAREWFTDTFPGALKSFKALNEFCIEQKLIVERNMVLSLDANASSSSNNRGFNKKMKIASKVAANQGADDASTSAVVFSSQESFFAPGETSDSSQSTNDGHEVDSLTKSIYELQKCSSSMTLICEQIKRGTSLEREERKELREHLFNYIGGEGFVFEEDILAMIADVTGVIEKMPRVLVTRYGRQKYVVQVTKDKLQEIFDKAYNKYSIQGKYKQEAEQKDAQHKQEIAELQRQIAALTPQQAQSTPGPQTGVMATTPVYQQVQHEQLASTKRDVDAVVATTSSADDQPQKKMKPTSPGSSSSM